jgi:hypothetical protein
MSGTLYLHASSLAHKFGFSDGDALEYVLDEEYYLLDVDAHELLILLVKQHLLPLIPHVTVYTLPSIHNPIRCDEEFKEELLNSDIQVDVTYEQIQQAILSLKERNK